MDLGQVNNNFNRIEIAIDKLTMISGNLDKLLGVHEERLKMQEKKIDSYDALLEKRRETYEANFADVYNKMRNEDESVIDKINKNFEEVKKENAATVKEFNTRITKLESKIYYIAGGIAAITFILMYGQSFIHLITAASAAK